MKRLFDAAIKAVKMGAITDDAFSLWIAPLQYRGEKDGQMVIVCPNSFTKKRFREKYLETFLLELKNVGYQEIAIILEVSEKKKVTDRKMVLPDFSTKNHPGQRALPCFTKLKFSNGVFLKKDVIFETFVVGESNEFAFSAALSLASGRGLQQPLFFLANPGLGKSHLCQSIGHQILKGSNTSRVFYTTASNFSSEMVRSFKKNNVGSFLERYRNGCDILLLEDVQFLGGKRRTQEELAGILDHLISSGKRIGFSACYSPAEIPKLDSQLRSRMENSIISKIDPPDFQTRVRIIKKVATLRNQVKFPPEVAHFLASNLTGDVRPLIGGLSGVIARSSLLGVPISLRLAKEVVDSLSYRKELTPEIIKRLICKEFGISVQDIISKSKKQKNVHPRDVAMFLCRKFTDAPLHAVGKNFNRYHATVIHAVGKIEERIKNDVSIARQIELISEKLENGDF